MLNAVSNHPAPFALVVLARHHSPPGLPSPPQPWIFFSAFLRPSHLYYPAPQHYLPSHYHHTVSIERSPTYLKDFTERGCSKSLQKNKILVGDTASASRRASWTCANAGRGLSPSLLQSKTAMAGVSADSHFCGLVKSEARLDRSRRHLSQDANTCVRNIKASSGLAARSHEQ